MVILVLLNYLVITMYTITYTSITIHDDCEFPMVWLNLDDERYEFETVCNAMIGMIIRHRCISCSLYKIPAHKIQKKQHHQMVMMAI